jgi:hypothetical protein
MTGYELSRNFFDWCFENPEKISPNHTALYFFICEHSNRMGGKTKFGLPTTMAKDAIGIRSYNTYIKTLNDLVEFGFIELIEKSKNQYSSNIVALSNFNKAHNKALDKALIKHTTKQHQSIDSIDKQLNKEQLTIDIYPTFDDFWNLYANKKDKEACVPRWNKLTQKEKEAIMEYLPAYIQSTPNKEFRKHPKTFLHNKSWNNEITTNKSTADRISEAGQQQALNFIFNK